MGVDEFGVHGQVLLQAGDGMLQWPPRDTSADTQLGIEAH